MNALLVWCFVWSIGANLVDASRDKFCEFCRTQFVPLVSTRFAPLLVDLYGSYVDLASPVKVISNHLHHAPPPPLPVRQRPPPGYTCPSGMASLV